MLGQRRRRWFNIKPPLCYWPMLCLLECYLTCITLLYLLYFLSFCYIIWYHLMPNYFDRSNKITRRGCCVEHVSPQQQYTTSQHNTNQMPVQCWTIIASAGQHPFNTGQWIVLNWVLRVSTIYCIHIMYPPNATTSTSPTGWWPCCFNVGLSSLTMAQQQPNIGSLSLAGSAVYQHDVHFAASPLPPSGDRLRSQITQYIGPMLA